MSKGHDAQRREQIEARLGFCLRRCWPLHRSTAPGTSCRTGRLQSRCNAGSQVFNRGGKAAEQLSSGLFKQYDRDSRKKRSGTVSASVDAFGADDSGEETKGGSVRGTRQRAAKRGVQSSAREEYKARMTAALDAELKEEMAAFEKRIKEWTPSQLAEQGYALFGLVAKPDGYLFRERIFRFANPVGDGLLPSQHQFTQGDIARISVGGPSIFEDGDAIEGVVLERARRYLRLVLPVRTASELDLTKQYRLDLSANQVAYERAVAALEAFASSSGDPVPLTRVARDSKANGDNSVTKKKAEKTPKVKGKDGKKNGGRESTNTAYGQGLHTLRFALLWQGVKTLQAQVLQTGGAVDSAGETPEKMAAKAPPWASGKELGSLKGGVRKQLAKLEERGGVNKSQAKAIEAAMTRRLTLWQGPPGTGKTRTLLHFLLLSTRLLAREHKPILACADSNIAVDNLLEGLLELGLKVVRIGQPVKVKATLRHATLEALIADHPQMARAASLRGQSVTASAEARGSRSWSKERQQRGDAAMKAWRASEDAEAIAIKEVLDDADVIVATCIGAGDPVLEGRTFRVCVIDEATQATQPSSLVPLVGGADNVVLVGDQKQLPPTVISLEAAKAGLEVSLFEELQRSGVKTFLLDTQYRMHPALAAFPSQHFYDGRLTSFPTPEDRPAPKRFAWPDASRPIAFLDCSDGREEISGENSRMNQAEASMVVKTVTELLQGGDLPSAEAIGVIAPYSGQVRLLQDLFFSPPNTSGAARRMFDGLEVKTVDGFQGREKEVIVLCTVRSNTDGQLGFVADARRMNVALTRAKRGLIVVGNQSTLSKQDPWRSWLAGLSTIDDDLRKLKRSANLSEVVV
ncbi:RNA helicase nonsense mRNA reducing factor [Klebsormidium nitens]|uniref:RNA helicase nonsense mRNA reducing factor n=1 Tax=Klebsormidium nitens TaxID=105231 RepID=A0A0U9HIU8_KLENI|nr:RNA helicase nonsense mRNA reducing factor [Klebsormidium nitens]|eukprot:GAQ80606.1 RNA helicase nonsense mRNA reducing factor [Klebsormidium nitens]